MSKPESPSVIIKQAIIDLTNANRVCSRQVISMTTGLKLSIVDDHLKTMLDNGILRRPVNGIVELVEDGPVDRHVSVTYLNNGRVKLEVGDHVLDLSLREAKNIGAATAGTGLQFGR